MNIEKLRQLMAELRDPKTGCPWDSIQTMKTIVPFTLEEAYELADAIERDDIDAIKGEMGDLLFQVIFYTQIAEENQWFNFTEVLTTLHDKLITRHPHVFNAPENMSLTELHQRWENQKHSKRQEQGATSLLDDVPKNLPGLTRAQKLQKRAALVGFDWQAPSEVFEKLKEEMAECEDAMDAKDLKGVAEEIGDLLFTCVSFARHFKLDAETLMRQANQKFEKRFRGMEHQAKKMDQNLNELTLEALESLWQAEKYSQSTK